MPLPERTCAAAPAWGTIKRCMSKSRRQTDRRYGSPRSHLPRAHAQKGSLAPMPINIPDGLPAKRILQQERIFALEEDVARKQQIRPLRVALLNLMPTKITTETQILRKLSNTPLQIEVELLRTKSHVAKNVS